MSAMVFIPPSTQLEIGQEMNLSFGSMMVTLILGSHLRMYLAQVAPP